MDADVAVSRLSTIPDTITRPFVDALRGAGLEVAEEEREPEAYAALEWLVPTAIVLFFAQNYFGAFLQEMGKDHYTVVKAALLRLVRRTNGPTKEVTASYVTSEGKVSHPSPPVLSIWAPMRWGRGVTFVFEDETPHEQCERSVERLFEVLRDHHAHYPDDALTLQAQKIEHNERYRVVMRYNADREDWTIVDIRPRQRAPGKQND